MRETIIKLDNGEEIIIFNPIRTIHTDGIPPHQDNFRKYLKRIYKELYGELLRVYPEKAAELKEFWINNVAKTDKERHRKPKLSINPWDYENTLKEIKLAEEFGLEYEPIECVRAFHRMPARMQAAMLLTYSLHGDELIDDDE